MQPFAGPSRPHPLSRATSPAASPTLLPTNSSLSITPLVISPTSSTLSQHKPLKSQIPAIPRRLLVPTSVPNCTNTDTEPDQDLDRPTSRPGSALGKQRHHGSGHVQGKSGRARAGSAPLQPTQSLLGSVHRWFEFESNFEVVEENLQLVGYQIYAVEPWICDHNRATVLLTVYTGDPKDKITVTALAPTSTLPESNRNHEWEKALLELRRDHARPRETDKGVIMVTSLANFRSDYTVVHIPDGNFLAHREQLYVNIDLIRFGCGGRSALTLQPPSDTSKDKFLTLFQFKEALRGEVQFKATILALVRIIQCALSLFELFPIGGKEQNGLLCNLTTEGLQKWAKEIGEPYMKIQTSSNLERLAEPHIVSALISLVISMRNKLSVMGFSMPKDPFFYPRRFTRTLATFVNQRLAHAATSASSPAPSIHGGAGGYQAQPFCHHAYLNLTLIKRIDLEYEKHRGSDAFKLHRAVLNKIDDITTATTSAIASASSKSGLGHAHAHSRSFSLSHPGGKERDAELVEATTDLGAFVAKVVLTTSTAMGARAQKDAGAQSLRCLWTGKLEQLERKRLEGVLSDAEEEKEREKERERERSDFSDEDGDLQLRHVLPWSNKMQRKIEDWTGRSRKKSSSIDLSIKDKSPEKDRRHSRGRSASGTQLPSVIISRDADGPGSGFSSGQVSPISPSGSLIALGGFSSAHNSALAVDDAEYFRRVQQFNQMRPAVLNGRRITSWSDPVSAEDILLDEPELRTARQGGFPRFGVPPQQTYQQHQNQQLGLGVLYPPWAMGAQGMGEGLSRSTRTDSSEEEGRRERRRRLPLRSKLKRSLSLDDREFKRADDCLTVEKMRIDVELCTQVMLMYRRRFYIQSMITTYQALITVTSATNDVLRKYHEDHAELIQDLAGKCQIVADIEEALSQAEAASAETDALLYEASYFDINTLWRMAQNPRRRVFAIRDRVFGVRAHPGSERSKRYPASSHGRFNRVQRRLDGSERLVDFLGRTESDVEEERELPEIIPDGTEEEGDSELGDADEVERHLHGEGAEEGQLKALSTWLLTLFTKWGRVLGVGGAAAAPVATAVSTHSALSSNSEGEHKGEGEGGGEVGGQTVTFNGLGDREKLEKQGGKVGSRRPSVVLVGRDGPSSTQVRRNGHGHNRLSTVGEEEEGALTDLTHEELSEPENFPSPRESGGLESSLSS